MIKDGYEDYQRHKADKQENYQTALVFNRGSNTFEEKAWAMIQIGDIVKVTKEKNLIPCDLMPLFTAGKEKSCFVETKNLDGETNLKPKTVHPDL
jgi:P-type E1-E2 ATPase